MAKELIELPGIITVLNTPFDPGGRIDEPGLRQHVRYAVEAGVAGILAPAMASEVGALSEEERVQIVAAVVDEVDGRIPVIGGASADTQAGRVQACRKLTDLGCAGVLVSIPFDDETTYIGAVIEVAAARPGFLMIQDWDFMGTGLPIPLIVRLFEEVEAFRCLKIETVPAGPKYSEVLKATKGRLHVSGGWAVMQMNDALDRGVHAFMPTALHRTYVRIHRAYQSGNREEARELFERVLPILAFSNQHLDVSIHFFKRLLHAQGIYSTPDVRAPRVPFDEHFERTAAELIERAIDLEGGLDESIG